MSTLWTPDGEHRVPAPGSEPASESSLERDDAAGDLEGDSPEAQALRDELAQLERELRDTPVEDIIANHCYGFFQLAALHLGQRPPNLDDARLAVDALAAVVDALGERLGPSTETLRDALAQIRLAYVQISAAQPGGNGSAATHLDGDASEASPNND